jgi:hypothetical protein
MLPLDLDTCVLRVGRLLTGDFATPVRRAARRATVRLLRLHPGDRDAVTRVRLRVEAELAVLTLLAVLQDVSSSQAAAHVPWVRGVLDFVRAGPRASPGRAPNTAAGGGPAGVSSPAVRLSRPGGGSARSRDGLPRRRGMETPPTRPIAPPSFVLVTSDLQYEDTAPHVAAAG